MCRSGRSRWVKLEIVVAAFWLTVLGGVILAVDAVVAVPKALGVLGAAGFVGGMVLVLSLAVADARRSGSSVTRSLWRGAKTALRWAWDFMP